MATSPFHDHFPSPNAIPPRTSSQSSASGHGHSLSRRSSTQKSVHVLRPKPESEWLARPRSFGAGLHARSASVEERRSQFKTVTDMPTLVDIPRRTSVMAPPSPLGNGTSLKNQLPQTAQEEEEQAAAAEAAQQQPPYQFPEKPPTSSSPVSSLPTWTPQKESILLAPYTYLENHPGKDIRSQLIHDFNAWLQVPPSSLSVITKVVGMLHTSSLLIDDVEDSSVLRRGVPVAHSIFGTAQTINSANYVYFLALQDLTKLNNPDCSRIFVTELLNLHRGQGMDLFWRDTLTCPTEAEYLEMVGNKTGGLFRLAVKLMMAESSLGTHTHTRADSHDNVGPTDQPPSASAQPSSVPDCVPLVSTIGLLFQVLDDYLNLQSTAYTERKGLCEDLTEGKFSFPVIHAIRTASEQVQQEQQAQARAQLPVTPPKIVTNGFAGAHAHSSPKLQPHQSFPSALPQAQPAPYTNNILLNILSQRTRDDEVKRYAVRYMEQMGSFKYTRGVVAELHAEAERLVEEVAAKVGGEAGEKGRAGLMKILGMLRAE